MWGDFVDGISYVDQSMWFYFLIWAGGFEKIAKIIIIKLLEADIISASKSCARSISEHFYHKYFQQVHLFEKKNLPQDPSQILQAATFSPADLGTVAKSICDLLDFKGGFCPPLKDML